MKRISIRHAPNGECGNRCKNNSCPSREFSLLPLVLRSLKTTCHGDWFQLSRFGSGGCVNSRNVIKSERCWKVDVDGIAVCAEHFHPFVDERERWWTGHAKAWNGRWVQSWVSLPVGWVLALSSYVGSRLCTSPKQDGCSKEIACLIKASTWRLKRELKKFGDTQYLNQYCCNESNGFCKSYLIKILSDLLSLRNNWSFWCDLQLLCLFRF